jgi:hypothetical protein
LVLDFPTRSSFVELAKRIALAAVYQLEGWAFSGEALARVKLGRRERAASVPTSKAQVPSSKSVRNEADIEIVCIILSDLVSCLRIDDKRCLSGGRGR